MLAEIMMARVDDRWRTQGIAMGDGAPGEGGGRCEACLLAATPSSPDEPVRGGRRAAGGLPEPASELPTPPASLTTTCRWQTARGLASPASCMTLAFFRRYLLARPALPARSPAIYAHASARPCGAPAPALPMLPGLHPPVHPGCCARSMPPMPARLALALAPGPFPRLRALPSPRARLSSSSRPLLPLRTSSQQAMRRARGYPVPALLLPPWTMRGLAPGSGLRAAVARRCTFSLASALLVHVRSGRRPASPALGWQPGERATRAGRRPNRPVQQAAAHTPDGSGWPDTFSAVSRCR